jgi:hypothetical protein
MGASGAKADQVAKRRTPATTKCSSGSLRMRPARHGVGTSRSFRERRFRRWVRAFLKVGEDRELLGRIGNGASLDQRGVVGARLPGLPVGELRRDEAAIGGRARMKRRKAATTSARGTVASASPCTDSALRAASTSGSDWVRR